ncbi:MAG TPA: hypothetical protein VF897_08685 [Roseiflexaceae bacterium]
MNQPSHFPLTTAHQRRLVFQTWAATGAGDRACRTAHVGRRTCAAGPPRGRAGSAAAWAHVARRAPKTTRRTSAAGAPQGSTLRRPQPAGGHQRRADERANANTWVLLLRPATRNRRRAAALWPTPATAAKKGAAPREPARPRRPARP